MFAPLPHIHFEARQTLTDFRPVRQAKECSRVISTASSKRNKKNNVKMTSGCMVQEVQFFDIPRLAVFVDLYALVPPFGVGIVLLASNGQFDWFYMVFVSELQSLYSEPFSPKFNRT
jgi:hypothetical protein